MRVLRRRLVIKSFFPSLNASFSCIFEAVVVIFVQISCLAIERILGIELVETFTSVQQYLPDMIDISSPFMKPPFNIQFMTFGVDKGMEDGVLKKEPRTVAVGVVFRYQDLEAEDAFLINALTNEYDAEPA